MANLASMYILGEGGLEVDRLKGRALAVASAEQNDLDGMRIVAALEGRYDPNGGPADLTLDGMEELMSMDVFIQCLRQYPPCTFPLEAVTSADST